MQAWPVHQSHKVIDKKIYFFEWYIRPEKRINYLHVVAHIATVGSLTDI